MYPATLINEQLKRVLVPLGKCPKDKLSVALHAPLLTLKGSADGITEDDAKAINLLDDHGLIRLPFELFRFCIETPSGDLFGMCERRGTGPICTVMFTRTKDGIGENIYAIINQHESGKPPFAISYDARIYDTETLADVTKQVEKANMEVVVPPRPEDVKPEDRERTIKFLRDTAKTKEGAVRVLRGMIASFTCLGELMGRQPVGGVCPEPDSIFSAMYGLILVLSYEYQAPHNFVARVKPDKPGKSVEWLKAREHLTIIHRHHEANNAAVKHGSVVPTDPNKQVQRIAHSRRAHTRLLRSPKFRYKMGQRVVVRATWCGPREWKDTAGQVYQILEPVAPPVNNL